MDVRAALAVHRLDMRPRDPAIVTEAELRRYLRRAIVLLGDAESCDERVQVLRSACHLTSAVLLGIAQLLREELPGGIPEPIEDPLTSALETATMRMER